MVITQYPVQLPHAILQQPGMDEFPAGSKTLFLACFGNEKVVYPHLDSPVEFPSVFEGKHLHTSWHEATNGLIRPAAANTFGEGDKKLFPVLPAVLVVHKFRLRVHNFLQNIEITPIKAFFKHQAISLLQGNKQGRLWILLSTNDGAYSHHQPQE